jgi:catechol 2,3-dioxygenase-like lactoylglutathione lyase family enzyme
MWEPFTEDARQSIILAQEAAVEFGNNYIGTEHLLAGIIGLPSSGGVRVLTVLGVELAKVRQAIETSARRPGANVTQEMVFTLRAKRAIELAFEAARTFRHNYVGTEHLLLGILHEHDGQGALILRDLGVDLAQARNRAATLERAALPFSCFDHVQLAMPPGKEDEARGFYVTLLGMTEIPKPARLAQRGGVWFASGELQLHLGVDEDFHAGRKSHPALRCNDYDGLISRLGAAGVEVQTERYLSLVRAYIYDPFGNRIELVG